MNTYVIVFGFKYFFIASYDTCATQFQGWAERAWEYTNNKRYIVRSNGEIFNTQKRLLCRTDILYVEKISSHFQIRNKTTNTKHYET